MVLERHHSREQKTVTQTPTNSRTLSARKRGASRAHPTHPQGRHVPTGDLSLSTTELLDRLPSSRLRLQGPHGHGAGLVASAVIGVRGLGSPGRPLPSTVASMEAPGRRSGPQAWGTDVGALGLPGREKHAGRPSGTDPGASIAQKGRCRGGGSWACGLRAHSSRRLPGARPPCPLHQAALERSYLPEGADSGRRPQAGGA